MIQARLCNLTISSIENMIAKEINFDETIPSSMKSKLGKRSFKLKVEIKVGRLPVLQLNNEKNMIYQI